MKINKCKVLLLIALCLVLTLVFAACDNGSFDAAKKYSRGGGGENGGGNGGENGGGNGGGGNQPNPNLTIPLCFTAQKDDTSVKLVELVEGAMTALPSLQFSLTNEQNDWQDYKIGDTITLNTGETVYFRGYNLKFNEGGRAFVYFCLTGKPAVSGNIMSLVDPSFRTKVIPADYCFYYLFMGCSFTGAPVLPATTLKKSCYHGMFDGCENLTEAPELPAETLAPYCYSYMFANCKSLGKAPDLPVETLAPYCYSHMFAGCSSLGKAPDLPATTLAESCYESMFSSCTSLTKASALPATTLKNYCYHGMFEGCENLTKAPEELPAETLTKGCYYYMFAGCSSLEKAPVLKATTLASTCYNYMFGGCNSLSYIEVYFTTWHNDWTEKWVYTEVTNGTFKCPSVLPARYGEDLIPSGWTRQTF